MTQPSWIGQTLNDRYEIQELLGQGGMSAVYKASDPNLRRVVAVKMIHSHLSKDPEFVRRFEEEAASVAQLRHPNLIQVYDFNHDGETYYIVFEFVPGESMQERLKRMKQASRPMDISEVTNIVAKSADGLQYAHSKGLIHRDIKPANIMLNVTGDPIIMDFGIAKIMGGTQHTATGAVLGTARYMSPEQIKGERIDPRTDIYSLGVTLFEMLGGRPPFEADSAMTLMMMHMTDPVPNLQNLRADVPAGLMTVVNKALAKDQADRYQTAAKFAAALRNFDDAAAVPVMAATVFESTTPRPVDPGATILEPVTAEVADTGGAGIDTGSAAAAAAAASATGGTIAPAAAPPPPPPPAPTRSAAAPSQGGGGSRTLLYAVGGIVVLLLLAIGVWAAFFRGPGGDETAGGGGEPPTAVVELTDIPDSQATIDAGVANELATREAIAMLTAEALPPTDIPQPEATATEQVVEATELPPVDSVGAVDEVVGVVVVITASGEQLPVTADTPIVEGSQYVTGDDGQLTLTLDDESIVQMIETSSFTLNAVPSYNAEENQQTDFTLWEGDLLLRQPAPGNELVVYGPAGNLISTLLNPSASTAAPKQAVTAKRVQQAGADEAAMSVYLQDDIRVVISCFSGVCYSGNGSLVRPGWETVVALNDGAFISSFPINSTSESYQKWQEACGNCIDRYPDPVQPTATVPPTEPPPVATATLVATPTEQAAAYSSRITNIALENGVYIVSYETVGYTEQVPGQHVHFYFDTVSEANAGSPGSGPWKLYGGPRPFTQYTEADRGNASSMCIRVANPNHSIISGSGNCFPLP